MRPENARRRLGLGWGRVGGGEKEGCGLDPFYVIPTLSPKR